jgi:hypothetical protein
MLKRLLQTKYSALLILLTVIAIAVRLYKIDSPIADWHSFRQVDTAAVAKLFQKNGIDLLHPKYFDLSNIQSGKENKEGFSILFRYISQLQFA